jgi:hypothetical protein
LIARRAIRDIVSPMSPDLVVALPRALLAVTLWALTVRTSWRAACALIPAGQGRGAAALTLHASALTLGAHVLLGVGAFSAWGVGLLGVTLAIAAYALPRAPAAPGLALPPRDLAALLPLAALLAWRWLRASVAPSLAPDSMTYHLYRAARWVQLGHDAPEDWPDAAGYYEFFSAGAEVFWSLGLALTGEDLGVATVGVALALACGVGATACARAFGADDRRALFAGATLCAVPAVQSTALTGYSDVWAVATLLLAVAHLRRSLEADGARHGAMALLAVALHLLAKTSSVLAAVPLGALALWRLHRSEGLSRRQGALVVVAAAAVVAPPLLRAWIARGSPLFPLPLGPLHPGGAQFVMTHSGGFSPGAPEPSPLEVLRAFSVGLPGMDVDPPGWGVAWLIALPIAGLAVRQMRGRERALALFALGLAVASLGSMFSGTMRELRTGFLPFSPRLYLAVPGLILCLAARVKGPRWDALWVLLAALSPVLAWPRALSPAVTVACAQALPWLLASAAVGALAWRLPPRAARLAAVALGLSVAFVGVRGARGRHRDAILADMGGPPRRRAYEVNPVGGAMRVFWRAGDALSRDCARRTAAAFGWAPPGHRIFRYPLMGPRQQNQVLYVPVTRDGEVIDLADEAVLAPRVDPARWYARLIAQGVDHVVTSPPHPRELSWMLSHPTLFEPIAPEAQPLGVFRVRAVHRCPR